MDTDQIKAVFPKSEARPGQIEAIKAALQAFQNGKKFYLLDAPTGSGKSVIGYTLARLMGSVYYLTSTKILQSQLERDFPDVVTLKGRNAYKCVHWQAMAEMLRNKGTPSDEVEEKALKDYNCANGYCKRQGLTKCELCVPKDGGEVLCPYWIQLYKAVAAPLCSMNYKSFLYQMMTQQFGPRNLLILDEGHNVEGELMDFISLVISDKLLTGIHFNDLGSVAAFQQWFREINLNEIIKESKRLHAAAEDMRRYEELERMQSKYAVFAGENPEEWAYNYTKNKDGSTSVEFKPVFIRKYAKGHFFNWCDHVLIMSGTLLNHRILMECLNIDRDEAVSYRMPNRFPKENRPVYFSFAGSMNFKNKSETLPKLVAETDRICRHYVGKRGIVHTHNFEIAKRLLEECSPEVKSRMLFQERFYNKEEMLEVHARQEDSIIVAPAMHEGIDLFGDLSRFQILCKVPYPNFHADAQLKRRMEVSPEYYQYLSVLKVVQAVGRSIRSAQDWADTYLLDSEFERFFQRNQRMIPRWFMDSIVST